MGEGLHKHISKENMSILHRWTFGNSAARNAATGIDPSDINKAALQLDDYSWWQCISVASGVPTWKPWAGSIYSDTSEPTGFVDRTATLSWDDATLTFTITGDHDIYLNGEKYSNTTDSIAITDATDLYWIYYTSANVLTVTTTFPGFNQCLVATVYWNTVTDKGLLGDERHGCIMDNSTHKYMHETIGARFEDGFALTIDDTTFTMATGEWHDEDIEHTPAEQTTCHILYKDGSSDYKWVENQTKYYYESGGSNIYYNNGTTLTEAPSNNYVAYWFFATPDPDKPIVTLMGQRVDTTLASARLNNTYENLNLGTLPSPEYKVLYRVILRNDATPYEETQDLRTVSNLPGGNYTATDHGALSGLSDDDHTQYLLADGTRALSADWDAGSFKITAEQLESDVTTGTAPLIVASTTKVDNLQAASVEGTGVKSTGESGGTKFLREDGDGTCSWQTAGGGGVDYIRITLGGEMYTGDGIFYFQPGIAGDLTSVRAFAVTAPTGANLDFQIYNYSDSVDMLSTVLQIDASSNADDGNAVIDTDNDDVVATDILRIDVDTVGSTIAGGSPVTFVFGFTPS